MSIAGRLMTKRGKGKADAHIQDLKGQIQICKKRQVGDDQFNIWKMA